MTVKSRLLEILEKEKGETLSGEKLAEELHCTRAAIWKAVKSLREEGYMIEAGRTWPAGTQFLFTAGCRNLPECDPRTERQSSGESASDCRGGSGSLQSSKENYRS